MTIEQLSGIEGRVLAALVEKEITTPDYYPLTLKATVAACNQKSNRDPVMALTEGEVEKTLSRLMDRQLAWRVSVSGSRVAKYEQNMVNKWSLDRQETALLCELILRGYQTMGELKNRGHRLFPFYKMIQVESAIQRLVERGFVTELPRQPGQKENRFAHLLSGEPVIEETPERHVVTTSIGEPDPSAVDELRRDLDQLRAEFEAFKRQFD